MTTTPALTRDIGQAERTMHALLERLLDEAGLSFAEWTVLNFLDGDAGQLAPADEAHGAGVSGNDDEDLRLAPTAAGEAVYRPVRRTVARISDELYGDLPPADLEATQRTLAEVTRRANARLAAAGG